jgi:hypothetical protein
MVLMKWSVQQVTTDRPRMLCAGIYNEHPHYLELIQEELGSKYNRRAKGQFYHEAVLGFPLRQHVQISIQRRQNDLSAG